MTSGTANGVEVLLRFQSNLSTGNFEGAEAFLHEDFFVKEVECFPYRGVYKGAEGWWKLTSVVNSYWNFHTIELVRSFSAPSGPSSDEETVCLMVNIKSLCRRNRMELDMKIVEIWTVKDGLLLSVEPYFWDTSEMMRILETEGTDTEEGQDHGGFETVSFGVGPELADRWAKINP
ncbi:nuclear transport factor 2 family protein [Streptomyces hirsutus]|uniref:nuclear transport factor 2 family protein n=1 Tax=Streptomyces hirsutus TaxID=35620 RepID=UPI0036BC66FB